MVIILVVLQVHLLAVYLEQAVGQIDQLVLHFQIEVLPLLMH
jgi:hypothetical protein